MIKIKIMMMTMIMRLGQNKLCERNTETYEKKNNDQANYKQKVR